MQIYFLVKKYLHGSLIPLIKLDLSLSGFKLLIQKICYSNVKYGQKNVCYIYDHLKARKNAYTF